ncbi:hypothetical protein T484DRAFT_1813845, partial [Baffinella frigidus]
MDMHHMYPSGAPPYNNFNSAPNMAINNTSGGAPHQGNVNHMANNNNNRHGGRAPAARQQRHRMYNTTGNLLTSNLNLSANLNTNSNNVNAAAPQAHGTNNMPAPNVNPNTTTTNITTNAPNMANVNINNIPNVTTNMHNAPPPGGSSASAPAGEMAPSVQNLFDMFSSAGPPQKPMPSLLPQLFGESQVQAHNLAPVALQGGRNYAADFAIQPIPYQAPPPPPEPAPPQKPAHMLPGGTTPLGGVAGKVEQELESALIKAGALVYEAGVVKEDARTGLKNGDLVKASRSHASRTNKGVHAIGQEPAIVEKVNQELTRQSRVRFDDAKALADIVVYGLKKVPKGFYDERRLNKGVPKGFYDERRLDKGVTRFDARR